MRWLPIEWSNKKRRMFLGIIMMYSFLSLAMSIHTLGKVAYDIKPFYLSVPLVFSMYAYFWVPSIVCILLVYHMLMNVYKYEEKK